MATTRAHMAGIILGALCQQQTHEQEPLIINCLEEKEEGVGLGGWGEQLGIFMRPHELIWTR